MKRFREMLRSKKGSVTLLATIGITALVGFAAISVDAGYAYVAYNRLEASTEAAALAGAKDIGVGGTPIATATAYSAVAGNKNVIPGVTATMGAGSPSLVCFTGSATSGLACSTNQTPTTAANGIVVQQTATVPTFFANIFGMKSITISASAVALAGGQTLPPLNVAFILDTTSSMGSTDSACGKTRIACAIQGFQTLLGELWPCKYGATCNGTNPVDEATVLQFPPLQTTPAPGSCGSLSTAPYAGISGNTSAKTTTATLPFTATPAFSLGSAGTATANVTGWPYVGQVSDGTTAANVQAGTYLSSKTSTTAVMSLSPAKGATIAKGDTINVWPPIYQLNALSADYRTSDTATTLNASSNLVKCLNSLQAIGGFGTYYADAINAAQQILVANTRTGARNVIILLSDGDANATAANMVAQGSSSLAKNECKAAVTAAQNAASNGTWVYAVGYGAPSGAGSGCSTDTGSYANPCYALSQIANIPGPSGTYTTDPTKFYSDNANGCSSPAHAAMALNTVFQNIAYSLTAPRLLPTACLATKPPGWC